MKLGEGELREVRAAVAGTDKRYVSSRSLDADMAPQRVGLALSILEDEGYIEQHDHGKPATYRVPDGLF